MTQAETKLLEHLLIEVRNLRRDVSLMMPTESVRDFKNTRAIVAAHKKARLAYK